MIAYLTGPILSLGDSSAIILAGSVGYSVKMSAKSLDALRVAHADGQHVSLWIHHRITETGQDLYGFFSQNDLPFFLRLLGVQGVGPKVALIASEHSDEVYQGNVAALKALPGIGEKTAKSIVMALGVTETVRAVSKPKASAASQFSTALFATAEQALAALNYKPAEAKKMIEAAAQNMPDSITEGDFITLALRHAPSKK
jgi:Holliday junction DNA helicase RuvA